MPRSPGRDLSFLGELRRRKVVRVGIVYAAVAWARAGYGDYWRDAF